MNNSTLQKIRALAAAVILVAPMPVAPLAAQSIDAGRGEVPVTLPAGYAAGTPAPLIVLLHGYTSNGSRQDAYFRLSEVADRYRFLMVAPDGTREAEGNRARFWNASEACCNFQGSEVDDVGYLLRVIDEVSSRWSVDPARVYLVGHSNGGFMAYRMAREHPDRIAAVASLAGAAQTGTPGAPGAPVHVLQIHGTDDETIRYQGGEIRDTRYPGARATVARWAEWNGCERRGSARERRDLDASLPGHETGVMVWTAGCTPGGSATLWTIAGGAHTPPLSDTFAEQVVEWLLAHPKPRTLLR